MLCCDVAYLSTDCYIVESQRTHASSCDPPDVASRVIYDDNCSEDDEGRIISTFSRIDDVDDLVTLLGVDGLS